MPIKFSQLKTMSTPEEVESVTKLVGLYADTGSETNLSNCLIDVSKFAKKAALDTVNDSAVHKSGTETILGVKNFENNVNVIGSLGTCSVTDGYLEIKKNAQRPQMGFKRTDKTREQALSTATAQDSVWAGSIVMGYSDMDVGWFETAATSDGKFLTQMVSTKDQQTYYSIGVKDDGTTFAPSPDINSNGSNIATTQWVRTLLTAMYPVGSVYIGTQKTCPMASIIPGSTWTLVAANKALWTGSGTNANTTIAAGLPNITGSVVNGGADDEGPLAGSSSGSGCFSVSKTGKNGASGSASAGGYNFAFNASSSNPIYGNSTTVQPPAYVVNVWRRTA